RDDAANTAAGVELNHFRDLIRQIVTRTLEAAEPITTLMRNAAADLPLDARQLTLVETYKRASPEAWAAFVLEARGVARAGDMRTIAAFDAEHGSEANRLRWRTLLARAQGGMVELGVNPAGVAPVDQEWQHEPWWRLYEPPDHEWLPLPPELRSS